MTMSRFCELTTNVLFIFVMHDLNGTLFLEVSFLFSLLVAFLTATLIAYFTTMYASL